MAFCENCGAPLSDDAEICPACGRTVKHINRTPVPAPDLTPDSADTPDQGSMDTGNPAEESADSLAGVNEQQPETQQPNEQQPKAQQPNAQQQNMYQPNMQQPNMQQQNMYQQTMQPDYRTQQTNNGNVMLAEGEKAIRSYRCAGILRHKKDAFLTVTNQRVIFQGRDNDSRVTQEAAISGITGVSSYYGRVKAFGQMMVSLVLFVLSVFSFSSSTTADYYYYANSTNGGFVFLGIVLLALAVILFCQSFQKRFILTITSKETAGNPVVLGASPRNAGPVVSVICHSTSETDRMVSELGALIHDVQVMGDNAVAKWRRNY